MHRKMTKRQTDPERVLDRLKIAVTMKLDYVNASWLRAQAGSKQIASASETVNRLVERLRTGEIEA